MSKTAFRLCAGLLAIGLNCLAAGAEPSYDPGASADEIRIGNTMAYSGRAAAMGTIGHTFAAYFERINVAGGINRRRVRFLSLDDGFNPDTTLAHTEQLVEREQVLFIAASLGTATSAAVQEYLNQRGVPQLFVISAAQRFNQPAASRWSVPFTWSLDYLAEARAHANYLQRERPGARIAILYQNNALSDQLLQGFGDMGRLSGGQVVALASFETNDVLTQAQMKTLRDTGADTLLIYAVTPKACAQAIKASYDIGWRGARVISSSCAHPTTILRSAGLAAAQELLSLAALQPRVDESGKDAETHAYLDFMRQYRPEADAQDVYNIYAYTLAQALTEVLHRCGDQLTRENVLRQAINLSGLRLPLLLPGITLRTNASDYATFDAAYVMQFDGQAWQISGQLVSSRSHQPSTTGHEDLGQPASQR